MIFEIPLWATFVAFMITLILWVEIGHRCGLVSSGSLTKEQLENASEQAKFAQSAFFGLLALLLAFSFSMANDRNEARKKMVIKEANAIGTLYLQSDLLREEDLVKKLIVMYRDERLAMANHPAGSQKFNEHVDKSVAIQKHLWQSVIVDPEVMSGTPLSVEVMTSLNALIDVHNERLAALNNRVSDIILLLMGVVAYGSMFWAGFSTGLHAKRTVLISIMTALIVSAVTNIILDLDRPARGLLETNQTAIKNSI